MRGSCWTLGILSHKYDGSCTVVDKASQCLECRPPLAVQIGGLFDGLAALRRREHLGRGLDHADAFCTAHGVLAGELQRVQCTFVESYETTFSGFGALAGFFLISASATAASRVAESLTRALRRTPGEGHAVAAQEGGDNQVCAY